MFLRFQSTWMKQLSNKFKKGRMRSEKLVRSPEVLRMKAYHGSRKRLVTEMEAGESEITVPVVTTILKVQRVQVGAL